METFLSDNLVELASLGLIYFAIYKSEQRLQDRMDRQDRRASESEARNEKAHDNIFGNINRLREDFKRGRSSRIIRRYEEYGE